MAFAAGQTPAFMAVQDAAGAWIETGFAELSAIDDAMIAAVDAKDLQKIHFAPVRLVKFRAERPYSGSGSTVGPAAKGRVDFSDPVVERACDKVSPVFFDYCCTGKAFTEIIFAHFLTETGMQDNERLVQVKFTGINVSSYEFIGDRFFDDKYKSGATKIADTSELTKSVDPHGSRKEQITLWYTTVSITHRGVTKGFDAGTQVPL